MIPLKNSWDVPAPSIAHPGQYFPVLLHGPARPGIGWDCKGAGEMTFRELCSKEVVQLKDGACLGRVDDLELDADTARIGSLLLLGRPGSSGCWAGTRP